MRFAIGDAFSHRHPRGRHEFGPAAANGRGLARPDALAAGAAPDAGEPVEISLDVAPQPLREVVPGRPLLGLDRRLDEPVCGPALDFVDTAVPGSGDGAPGSGVAGQRRGLGAVAHVAVEDRLIDGCRGDLPGGAIAHQ